LHVCTMEEDRALEFSPSSDSNQETIRRLDSRVSSLTNELKSAESEHHAEVTLLKNELQRQIAQHSETSLAAKQKMGELLRGAHAARNRAEEEKKRLQEQVEEKDKVISSLREVDLRDGAEQKEREIELLRQEKNNEIDDLNRGFGDLPRENEEMRARLEKERRDMQALLELRNTEAASSLEQGRIKSELKEVQNRNVELNNSLQQRDDERQSLQKHCEGGILFFFFFFLSYFFGSRC
jgi:chromosome segregation ATPase